MIRRELERREHEGLRRDQTARATATVRPLLVAVSATALAASIAVIFLPLA